MIISSRKICKSHPCCLLPRHCLFKNSEGRAVLKKGSLMCRHWRRLAGWWINHVTSSLPSLWAEGRLVGSFLVWTSLVCKGTLGSWALCTHCLPLLAWFMVKPPPHSCAYGSFCTFGNLIYFTCFLWPSVTYVGGESSQLPQIVSFSLKHNYF